MKKRIIMITLLASFIAGGTALFSAIAMAHGGAGMMGGQDGNIGQTHCQDEAYSGTMHRGDGYEMMGGMMGYGGMGSMMRGGHGGHMMDFDDMRHGSVLNQADKLGLSDDQISKLNTLRVAERKDIIQKEAEVKVARLDLSELVASNHWTVKDAEPLIHKLENLEGDIHLRHLQALSDARNILTAEQLKQYSNTEQVDSGEYYCN